MAEPALPGAFGIRWESVARVIAIALLAAGGARIVYGVLAGTLAWPFIDTIVYLDAAERLRDGSPLYSEAIVSQAFRYAPWFAVAWIPLTFVPGWVVATLWAVVLTAASAYLLRPLPWWAWLFFGPVLFFPVYAGNVQPLMLAGLAYGLPRRSGPLFIALAASLKAFPVVLVLWYVGRREWSRVAWTLALTTISVVPMLAFDLSAFSTEPGLTLSLYGIHPALWAAVAALVAVWHARTRYGLLWASVAVIAALPRLLWYDIGYLALAAAPPKSANR